MPITWALASYANCGDSERCTSHFRLPVDAIRCKPASSSCYVLVKRSEKELLACKIVLARTAQEAFTVDPMIQLPHKKEALCAMIQGPSTDESPCFYWIPAAHVREAASVVLELEELPTRLEFNELEYKQRLQDLLQHQLLVQSHAVVTLPAPEGALNACFRVESTYPSTSSDHFVRVTPKTRITIVLPPQPMDQPTPVAPPTIKIGGLETERAALRELILLPLTQGDLATACGIEFPKGLLLSGPPGVGKTLLVRSVVDECQSMQSAPIQLTVINGSEILTSHTGDAEARLRSIFAAASAFATTQNGTAVIFLDELDALCPKRDPSGRGNLTHSRIVAQLLTLLDGTTKRANVIVIGATNLPNAIDPALRRPGRFDREVFVAPPDARARRQIFQVHTLDLPIDRSSGLLDALAAKSIGYVGADIASLCREALAIATARHLVALTHSRKLSAWWTRWQSYRLPLSYTLQDTVVAKAWTDSPVKLPLWFLQKTASVRPDGLFLEVNERTASSKEEEEEDQRFQVTMQDFDQAIHVVLASCLRGSTGFSRSYETQGYEAIGGQDDTKRALQQALEWPLRFPATFERLGVKPPRGLLLYGPPGCSKSSIVRAAAHSSGATFLSLAAAHVFSPFFGDAEAAVRQVFRDARAALPAIIFFDEIDVLVTKRAFEASASGSSGSGGSSASSRVLSTLLNEMDGVESADGLLVIGATNRPDCIDAALMRPGRFDRILYVGLPQEAERVEILRIHSRRMQLDSDVQLDQLAARTSFFSGAELESVCREAAMHALRESIDVQCVSMRHFEAAVASIAPVSSPESIALYDAFAARMGY